jgi:hypothetical protein
MVGQMPLLYAASCSTSSTGTILPFQLLLSSASSSRKCPAMVPSSM